MLETIKVATKVAGIVNPEAALFSKIASEGLNNLPDLPEENYINYWIVDAKNLTLSRNGQSFHCFKKGEKVTVEKSVISLRTKTYYCLLIQNIHIKSMKVKVQAFAIKTKQRLVPK